MTGVQTCALPIWLPVPDASKDALMTRMNGAVRYHFTTEFIQGPGNPDLDKWTYRDDFEYIESSKKYERRTKPFTLVNNDGVFHLFTPKGDFFWGWSNTSPKVAFGAQSSSPEGLKVLSGIVAALYIHIRNKTEKDTPGYVAHLNYKFPKIHPQETGQLFNMFGVETGNEIKDKAQREARQAKASEEFEAKILEIYPTLESALEAIDGLGETTTVTEPRAEMRVSSAELVRVLNEPYEGRGEGFLGAMKNYGATLRVTANLQKGWGHNTFDILNGVQLPAEHYAVNLDIKYPKTNAAIDADIQTLAEKLAAVFSGLNVSVDALPDSEHFNYTRISLTPRSENREESVLALAKELLADWDKPVGEREDRQDRLDAYFA